jgi:hypothetical protein
MGYSKFATKSWKRLWGYFRQIVKHNSVPNFLREFSVVSRNKNAPLYEIYNMSNET